MPQTALLRAAALFLAIGATACAGRDDNDSKADIKKEISDTLRRGDDTYDKKKADCYAEIVIDEAGIEALRDVDLSDDEPPPELADAFAAAALRAIEDCDIPTDGG